MKYLRAGGDTADRFKITINQEKMQESASEADGDHTEPSLAWEGVPSAPSLGRNLTRDQVIQRIVRLTGLGELFRVKISVDRRLGVSGRLP